MRLQPQVATEGSPELEDPYPGLELVLRKSRLATLYDISVGRLCVTDERPKAKEKCPSPEGTVVRPDGKVLGGSLTRARAQTLTLTPTPTSTLTPTPTLTPTLTPTPTPTPIPTPTPTKVLGKRTSDGSVVTGDLARAPGDAPAPGQVIATNTTLKPDGATTVGPDGQTLACSTVVGSDGRPMGQLLPDGDRPRRPFREFLAPVVRSRREKSAASPRTRRSSITAPFGSPRRLSKLRDTGARLDAVPLLAIKFEKVRSAAPDFLLPERPGQLLLGLDGTGAVGWRNADGSIVGLGPDDAGGAPGPLLVRNSIVRPDGAAVPVPMGTRMRKVSEGASNPTPHPNPNPNPTPGPALSSNPHHSPLTSHLSPSL